MAKASSATIELRRATANELRWWPFDHESITGRDLAGGFVGNGAIDEHPVRRDQRCASVRLDGELATYQFGVEPATCPH